LDKLKKLKNLKKEDSAFRFLVSVLTESFTVGIAVVSSIIAGAIVGWLIDEKLLGGRFSPWITTLFIIFGAIGGVKNLIYYSKKRMRESEKNERHKS
jgi:F0F1-type ATP synthase assembly protein I